MTSEARKKSHGIAAWPEEERPRERLLSRGPQALTDAELVAILIRAGFQGTNAVELGRQLLERFGSLRAMAEAPVTALLDVKGRQGGPTLGGNGNCPARGFAGPARTRTD